MATSFLWNGNYKFKFLRRDILKTRMNVSMHVIYEYLHRVEEEQGRERGRGKARKRELMFAFNKRTS